MFIDFSKAFDTVQHAILRKTLKLKNINGRFLNVLESLYKNLTSCVRVEDGLSDYFTCKIGTRQGCLISPILFCLFINDFVDHLKTTFRNGIYVTENTCDLYALMYADDVSSVSDTIIQFQRQINCIAKFCDEVKIQINLDKMKIMVFRNGGEHCGKRYFKNESIEIVSLYKYLGVYLTPKLSWTKNH